MANDQAQSSLPRESEADALFEQQVKKAEEFIAQEEGVTNRHHGWLGALITLLLVGMSLFHLYAAYSIVPTAVLRPVHVGLMLVLTFLLFPVGARFRDRVMWFDIVLLLLGAASIAYLLAGGDDFWDRNSEPAAIDIWMGLALIVLVLEAARRTTGWVMPLVVMLFICYAYLGPWLPGQWAHRGYDTASIVGVMYMTLEGIFGTAIDVSATLIILFTIYGAFLQQSGAGKFFLDFSFAALGSKPSGVGRTVVLSSFLLGGPSGSGVATTVTIGSVAYPMMKRAGYDPAAAGGLLAAGGLGAIISPPVLGAAAFLIAEFLKISYTAVLLMSVIPTLLYYFSLLLMVELDSRRYRLRLADGDAAVGQPRSRAAVLLGMMRRQGYHFLSLLSILAFMLAGFSPSMSVFWATVVTAATVFVGRPVRQALRGVWQALRDGSLQMLNVAATCAAAGLIVGIVAKTGLGLKFSNIVISYAGGDLFLTALFTALVVWVVGLAVPVTASYIICAVIAAPALIKLGVPDYAAHMFIFYYAVLSEVSPPTALAPFAAAAITGADPYKTTLQSWKYTMPAFVVPFMFVLTPDGVGLLLKTPPGGDWSQVAWIGASACIGIGAIAAGLQGWLFQRCVWVERLLLMAGGLALVYPHPVSDAAGFGLLVAAVVIHVVRLRFAKAAVVKI
ncbi:MAG: C4-dicarboxylate transporter permease [Herminiimonas sp.]|nr:C4-dicarboxylate transporter permease [Herminiimonas sp.]